MNETVTESWETAHTAGARGGAGGALGVVTSLHRPNSLREVPSARSAAILNRYAVAGFSPCTRVSHLGFTLPLSGTSIAIHSAPLDSAPPSAPRDTVCICARYAATTLPLSRSGGRHRTLTPSGVTDVNVGGSGGDGAAASRLCVASLPYAPAPAAL